MNRDFIAKTVMPVYVQFHVSKSTVPKNVRLPRALIGDPGDRHCLRENLALERSIESRIPEKSRQTRTETIVERSKFTISLFSSTSLERNTVGNLSIQRKHLLSTVHVSPNKLCMKIFIGCIEIELGVALERYYEL